MDDMLFICSGYRVPAGDPSPDRLEGGEPTGPVKAGVELSMDGADSIG